MTDVRNEGRFRDVKSRGAYNIVRLLKACAKQQDLVGGSKLYAHIRQCKCLKENCFVASALVNMYARCGALAEAQQVLNEHPVQDSVMWTALIAGYSQQGQGEEALRCLDCMQHQGYTPDEVTFVCALKACESMGSDPAEVEKIHDKVVSVGLLEKAVVLGSTLVDVYVRCGALAKAQEVFDLLPVRNVITWTALISGYAQQKQNEEALKHFDSMQYEGHSPDVVTFICALKACANLGAAPKGERIHDKILSLGLMGKDIVLGTTLVDMYAKCGALAMAQKVFLELLVQDVVTWNALIAGYAQHGQGEEALKCFHSMQFEGHSPDKVTFISALKACGSIGATAKGEKICDQVVSSGLLEKDIVLGNALIDMYARCAELAKAQQILKELPVQDVVTWNALIAGYVQQGQGVDALNCFDSMQQEGLTPDVVTFISVLKACGSIGAATKGERIHDQIVGLGMLEKNDVLRSTLMDMYVKCGDFLKVFKVLKEFPVVQDVVSWNALIGGYAQQGQSGEALDCFKSMQSEGVRPDSATFVIVLNTCSHSGLLDEAEIHFWAMGTTYRVTPNADHYCCMVDLYSRAGRINKALTVIERMPSTDNCLAWLALLGACCNWGNVRIGKLAFEHALHLEKNSGTAFICMANICTAAAMQEDADKIEMKVTN